MSKEKPPTYTPAPELPSDPELRRRFNEIVAVLTQTQTMAGAARSLSLSRNHFQTIFHRVLTAMIEAMTPKPAGRPAKPAREADLEAENQKLREENESLRTRTEAVERMMTLVGSIASGRTRLPRSQPKSRGKKTSSDEDPEPERIRTEAVKTMREQGATIELCAAALGISPSTVQRCRAKKQPPSKTARMHDPGACQQVRALVRATHGQIGAEPLRRTTGLPRRACAKLKRQELRELELERKSRCASVRVAAPGIVRGFDAMHVACRDTKAYWLVAADAAVPYRTSITTVDSYDADAVIAALTADFEAHGPPLVLRMDRIAAQRTPAVQALLDRYHVLPLHGPPRHPYYYGQLERQNREHRAWNDMLGVVTRRDLADAAGAMRHALNALWPRPTLDWWTAEQAWQARRPITVDRAELITEVQQRAAGLVADGHEVLHARRVATESALIERGLLTINQGGWC